MLVNSDAASAVVAFCRLVPPYFFELLVPPYFYRV
jgi:hypothetical protein